MHKFALIVVALCLQGCPSMPTSSKSSAEADADASALQGTNSTPIILNCIQIVNGRRDAPVTCIERTSEVMPFGFQTKDKK